MRKWKHSWPSETMKMDCSKGERFSVCYSIFIAFGHIFTEIMTQLNRSVSSYCFHDPTTCSSAIARAAGQYSVIDTVNFCVEMFARKRSIRWHLYNRIRVRIHLTFICLLEDEHEQCLRLNNKWQGNLNNWLTSALDFVEGFVKIKGYFRDSD